MVSSKKARGKKQQVSESSRLLNLLYSEGLRQQDLDADCRLLLGGSPEDVKAKVKHHKMTCRQLLCCVKPLLQLDFVFSQYKNLSALQALAHFVDRYRDGVINKPSAFLTKALINAGKNYSPAKNANSAILTRETIFCPSAMHLLGVLANEGLRSYDLDAECQAYLARTQPAVQTQVYPQSLRLFCKPHKHHHVMSPIGPCAGSPVLPGAVAHRQDQKPICVFDRFAGKVLQRHHVD